MTTLYASSAAATAGYYTQYLAQAVGEEPGVWSGVQADRLGIGGEVGAEALRLLLEGRDPVTGTPLGSTLSDRFLADGSVVRAVAGFSAPKSVSVLWALTGDERILAVHDQAVAAALAHVERFGSTTRVRVNGVRMFPASNGLTMATFRQSTSRADDPRLHTHAVISAKVQIADGRWLALDARYLKRHQRMLGGLYQSALRTGLHKELGVVWAPMVNGQAEIAGVPDELLRVFSKRTGQVETALADKLVEFRSRQGRDPTQWERAALTREAAVDTRAHKTGHGPDDLVGRWRQEANEIGWTAHRVLDDVRRAARDHTLDHTPDHALSLANVLDRLSAAGSTWSRADVLRAVCDLAPVKAMEAGRCAQAVERVVDRVLETCVNLDAEPGRDGSRDGRRDTDGRSVWIEPTATQYTSDQILTQEAHVLTWAMDRQADAPAPSDAVEVVGLDVAQADAARAVAGHDRLVLVEGPAGAGKTSMLRTAVEALTAEGRPVLGLAPTAKAARVLGAETGMPVDTIAKLLHEHARTDRPAGERYRPPAGTTVIVDSCRHRGTPTLHQRADLADHHAWRVVLVGDPRQLQAVGRGGLFTELCVTGRIHELATIHRFSAGWEATASLQLRHGDPSVFDTYEDHGRITNAHVDAINASIQASRLATGELDARTPRPIAGGEHAHAGDVVVTRRNDRSLTTSTGESVRNRDLWTVAATHPDGALTVTAHEGHGSVRLPAEYVREYVRLGYAATEPGKQGVTTDTAYHLVTETTTAKGLYVGATRGRDRNQLLVVTCDDRDACDILDRVLASDRADTPAHVQRRTLCATIPAPPAPRERRTRVPEPAWLTGWRDALTGQRDEVLADRRDRETDRREAAIEAAIHCAIQASCIADCPSCSPSIRAHRSSTPAD